MKYLKIFENFSLSDLDQEFEEAKYLYDLGLIDKTGLRYVEDLVRLERYIAKGSKRDLYLVGTQIQSLGALTEVGGDLWLQDSQIQDLGALTKVVGNLWLKDSQIQDLGELREVGRNLGLKGTPIAKTHTEQEIREQVQVRGRVLL
jgi:hypothetical protein